MKNAQSGSKEWCREAVARIDGQLSFALAEGDVMCVTLREE